MRPERKRRICINPETVFFKPRGVPLKQLDQVNLTLDELEAVRLCYLNELYQEEAAKEMDISRQTLGRVLKSANAKIADFIVNGKALMIGGGTVYHGQTHRRKAFCRSRKRHRLYQDMKGK